MAKPDLVKNAPSLLHAVALVQATHSATVLKIRQMSRSIPPDLYSPAVDIVRRVLDGQPYEWGERQAATLVDADQSKCAKEVLEALKPYLKRVRPDWIRNLDIEYYQAGADLQIPVRLAGLMRIDERFVVLVLHLWRKPLKDEQLRAALAILRNRLALRPELANAELHLIDISVPEGERARSYQVLGWDSLPPLAPEAVDDFVGRLYGAWRECQENPEPKRPKKPRPDPRQGDMFGHHDPDQPPS